MSQVYFNRRRPPSIWHKFIAEEEAKKGKLPKKKIDLKALGEKVRKSQEPKPNGILQFFFG